VKRGVESKEIFSKSELKEFSQIIVSNEILQNRYLELKNNINNVSYNMFQNNDYKEIILSKYFGVDNNSLKINLFLEEYNNYNNWLFKFIIFKAECKNIMYKDIIETSSEDEVFFLAFDYLGRYYTLYGFKHNNINDLLRYVCPSKTELKNNFLLFAKLYCSILLSNQHFSSEIIDEDNINSYKVTGLKIEIPTISENGENLVAEIYTGNFLHKRVVKYCFYVDNNYLLSHRIEVINKGYIKY
jgi:hypothetical protein